MMRLLKIQHGCIPGKAVKRPILARTINRGIAYPLFYQRIILIISFCLLFSMAALCGLCQAKTVIIPIQFRNASEVLPVIKNLLSQDGKATGDVRTNSLVITDDDESIHKIRTFLESYDRPVKQVRIRVRFQETYSSGGRSVSAEGGISGNNWKISTGGKKDDGLNIYLHDENGHRGRTSEYYINVTSGSPAYVLAGKDIPYRKRWIHLCRRYAEYVDTVVFQRIETGMEVRPVIVGDLAHIEITPRISHEGSGEQTGIIRFTKALTRLTVPLGQWVSLGGTDEKSNEVIRAILESGTGRENSSLSISLMVEAY